MINGELIVDNFAGGGGASTGIELATGKSVDIAINHDPEAIKMHKANHPHTKHYCENVWEVDPVVACNGHPVGLAWFSPDCKHFSKAKGGKPVEKNIRGLAWVVLKWAALVRPRVIMLENVEEFQTWGPCIPIRDKKTGRVIVNMTGRKNEARTRVAELGEVVPVDKQMFQPDPKRGDMVMTLKKKWFDMILSGVKTEEYREMKPYWEKRFINYFGRYYDFSKETPTIVWNNHKKDIVFRNGYGNDKPEFTAECTISEDYGNEEWGAEQGCKYYVLKIHRVYNEKNIVS